MDGRIVLWMWEVKITDFEESSLFWGRKKAVLKTYPQTLSFSTNESIYRFLECVFLIFFLILNLRFLVFDSMVVYFCSFSIESCRDGGKGRQRVDDGVKFEEVDKMAEILIAS